MIEEDREVARDAEKIDCRYGQFYVFRTDSIIGKSLKKYGEWAQIEIDLLRNYLRPGDIAIDVGAFIGTHALAFADAVGPTGRVLAFEPSPSSYQLLKLNVARNASHGNVEVYPYAISEGHFRFTEERPSGFGGVCNFGATTASLVVDQQAGPEQMDVTRTLDDWELSRCRLIKIDVEGHGAEVIRGARRLLETQTPIVSAEINSVEEGVRCMRAVEPLDYDVWACISDAFNPDNFNRSREVLFTGREVNLLMSPKQEAINVAGLARWPVHDVVRVHDTDDLVLAMLAKPQYKPEVLLQGRENTLGNLHFIVTSHERDDIDALIRKEDDEIKRLKAKVDRLSRSFLRRVTRPLRAFLK